MTEASWHIEPDALSANRLIPDTTLGAILSREAKVDERNPQAEYRLSPEDETACQNMSESQWSCVDAETLMDAIDSESQRVDALAGVKQSSASAILPIECKLNVYGKRSLSSKRLCDEVLSKANATKEILHGRSWNERVLCFFSSQDIAVARNNLFSRQESDSSYAPLFFCSPAHGLSVFSIRKGTRT